MFSTRRMLLLTKTGPKRQQPQRQLCSLDAGCPNKWWSSAQTNHSCSLSGTTGWMCRCSWGDMWEHKEVRVDCSWGNVPKQERTPVHCALDVRAWIVAIVLCPCIIGQLVQWKKVVFMLSIVKQLSMTKACLGLSCVNYNLTIS